MILPAGVLQLGLKVRGLRDLRDFDNIKLKMSSKVASIRVVYIVDSFDSLNKITVSSVYTCKLCISILNCNDDNDKCDVILSRVHRDIRWYRTVAEQGPWLFGVKGFVLYGEAMESRTTDEKEALWF